MIGVGYANFPVAFTSCADPLGERRRRYRDRSGPHNVVVGTAGELGIVGLVLLALFIVPLVVRRGWGPDGLLVQAILASLMIDAIFLDILSNRKQVWVAIGMASGLAYLAAGPSARGRRTIATPCPPSTRVHRPATSPVDARGDPGAAPGGTA